MVLDVAQRHPAGIQADDHLIQAAEPARPLRYQLRGEAAVAVPRHRQLNIADLAGDRLRGGAVARVRKQRRIRIAALIADMISQLDFQATLQSRLQHALQQAVIAAQRHLAGVDLLEDLIQRAGRLQPISQLPLPRAPLGPLALALGHSHSSVSSQIGSHCLHKRSDTSQRERDLVRTMRHRAGDHPAILAARPQLLRIAFRGPVTTPQPNTEIDQSPPQ